MAYAVIFGEIAPQSVCVRYGLSIGSFMAPFVLLLMWIMAPVAWPTAKLLDYLLGEDHGTMYNKPGLKTLVQLHKSLGTAPGDRLLEDEVTIINSVLDLKDKPVGDIMTPMGDVFTMSANTVLDERMMDTILSQGYSRIPVYAPENHRNFVGMLLVKMLITYDPEDCKRVRDFALATLPETGPYTSCLDIINFFQEGKSHMVLVSDFPGQDKGALGVVTLEDVIEELIGEEIIDESDVFVDVHKAIRRIAPAPRQKYSKLLGVDSDTEGNGTAGEDTPLLGGKDADGQSSRKPSFGQTTLLMRRKSSNASESTRDTVKPVPVRSGTQDFRKHLSHLGPSNVASKPRTTKYTSVKIKPGVGTIPEGQATTVGTDEPDARARSASESAAPAPVGGGEGAGLLKDAGRDASDGAEALAAGYGTMQSPTRSRSRRRSNEPEIHAEGGSEEPTKLTPAEASKQAEQHVHTPPGGDSRAGGDYVANGNTNGDYGASPKQVLSPARDAPRINEPAEEEQPPTPRSARNPRNNGHLSPGGTRYGNKMVIGPAHDPEADEDDEVGDMPPSRDRSKNRRTARSGSITETEIHVNGMKKMVLETNSSSDGEDGNANGTAGSSSPKQTVTSGKQVVTPPAEEETAPDGRTEELAQSEGDLMGSGNTSSANSGGATGGAKKKNKKKKKKGKKAGE